MWQELHESLLYHRHSWLLLPCLLGRMIMLACSSPHFFFYHPKVVLMNILFVYKCFDQGFLLGALVIPMDDLFNLAT
jgi:hypothetical protein